VRNILDRHARLESSETKLWRSSRGVHSGASSPAAAATGPEGTPHVARVEFRAVSSGEHQNVVNPPLPHPNPLGQLALLIGASRSIGSTDGASRSGGRFPGTWDSWSRAHTTLDL
jgi:hypothetical protein